MQGDLFPSSTTNEINTAGINKAGINNNRPTGQGRLVHDPGTQREFARAQRLAQQQQRERAQRLRSSTGSLRVYEPGWEPGHNLLFLAFLLEPEAALLVEALARQFLQTEGLERSNNAWKLLEPERLHISLLGLGGFAAVPPEAVAAARRLMRMITAPAAEMMLEMIMSFRRRRSESEMPSHPLVLQGRENGLQRISAELNAVMRDHGASLCHSFNPHVTLCYGPRLITRQPIPPIRLRLNEIVLIHSEQGKHRYHVLDRWPLKS